MDCRSLIQHFIKSSDMWSKKPFYKRTGSIDYLTAITPPCYQCVLDGQTDCIVEGEVSKLGNSFLQTWQKTHLKLYPNRLEFYIKKSDGQINRRTGVEVCVISVAAIGAHWSFPPDLIGRNKRSKNEPRSICIQKLTWPYLVLWLAELTYCPS